jgi:hypothetical protein
MLELTIIFLYVNAENTCYSVCKAGAMKQHSNDVT